jgi:hypothetical protein
MAADLILAPEAEQDISEAYSCSGALSFGVSPTLYSTK